MRVREVLRDGILEVLQRLKRMVKWEKVVEMFDLLMDRDCESISGNGIKFCGACSGYGGRGGFL